MSKLEKVITSKKFKDDMQRHANEQAEFFKVFESLMEYDKDRKIDLCAELEDHEKTNIERILTMNSSISNMGRKVNLNDYYAVAAIFSDVMMKFSFLILG